MTNQTNSTALPDEGELDAILRAYAKYHHEVMIAEPVLHGMTIKEAKQQLRTLMLKARRDELESLDTRRHYGKDYQDSLDELDEYKDNRIAELDALISEAEKESKDV